MKTKTGFFTKIVIPLLLFALLLIKHEGYAQDRWSFEFRPGLSVPTQKLGDTNLNTGFGLEGTFAYRFMPHLSFYAGWSWNRFGSDQEVGGISLDFEETGYTYGLQFIHPIGESNLSFLGRAGALSNHIEMELGDDIIADSGHGFGWQVEAGVAIPLGESWRINPSLRYRSLPRDLKFGNTSTSVDLNYLSLGVGISKIF